MVFQSISDLLVMMKSERDTTKRLEIVIQDDETKLSTEDVEQLLKNPKLSPFQKITLQDALTEGTHTREHVLQANRKSKPKDILKLFRKGNYG